MPTIIICTFTVQIKRAPGLCKRNKKFIVQMLICVVAQKVLILYCYMYKVEAIQ